MGGALATWISLGIALTGGGFDSLSVVGAGRLLILTGMFFSILHDLSQC